MATKKGIKDEFASVLVEIWRDAKIEVIEKLKKRAEILYKENLVRLIGCSVAVIGPPCSGKTTLLRVLKNPLLSGDELASYAKTEVEQFESFRAKFLLPVGEGRQIDFHFRVRKNVDVGGEEYLKAEHWADRRHSISGE